MEGTKSSHHVRMALALHLTMEGTNPLTMSEWIRDSSLSHGGNLDLEITKILPEVLELHPSQWFHQHISYLFLRHNILELHCSSLHHIPDMVIPNLDVLRFFLENMVCKEKENSHWDVDVSRPPFFL